MIEVRNLSKMYGEKVGALNIDFTVQRGEVVGLLGPNGSGKTTIMKMVTGCMPPSEGSVVVDGFDILDSPKEVTNRIGFLPEIPPLYPEMRVREYLAFTAAIKGVEKAQRRARVEQTMEMVHVTQVSERLIRNLSKGYKQRVGLAQAIVADPPVLILDEPTVGLDPKQMTEVRELIRELGNSHTIIVSSHILPEISMICGRVIILNNGRIVAEDSTDNLARGVADTGRFILTVKGPGGDTERILGSISGILTYRSIESAPDLSGGYCSYLVENTKNASVREPLFTALAAAAIPIIELRSVGFSLEEVFLQLTGDPAEKGEEL
jgi:ABC-2 type transport system ATP-binding protein